MPYFWQSLHQLNGVLTWGEKLILSVLALIIIGSGSLWWYKVIKLAPVSPAKGGTYVEGITSKDPAEIDLVIDKLTKIGLTYIDHNNHVNGALADHWEISPDGKIYTFYLRPNIDAADIATVYGSQPNWQNISVTAIDKSTLTINLKQSFAPLLYFTSDPIYEAGPYLKDRQNATEISFSANRKFVLGEPNIQRITLFIYPNIQTARAALQRQEIMGVDTEISGISGVLTKKLALTKQSALLFNLEKPIFQDKALRERIKNAQKLDTPLAATLVTDQDPRHLALANQFVSKAARIGLTISVESLNPVVLERDNLANDRYDLYLTDLNYGYDQDPYPYWHSSQIIAPGKNYAGYNNKEADKLIEDARQTLDTADRQNKYDAFREILSNDIPAIFYPKQSYNHVMSTRVKGVTNGIGVATADRFTEVWLWYMNTKRQPTP